MGDVLTGNADNVWGPLQGAKLAFVHGQAMALCGFHDVVFPFLVKDKSPCSLLRNFL